ncbi:MAG: hypothetical protein ACE5O2_17635 [Armatimonadota bacterium]
MERSLADFVAHFLDSPAKLDIALFYEANPSTMDTPTGIAFRISRPIGESAKALGELARRGLLRERDLRGGKYVIYSLSENEAVRKTLRELREAYLASEQERAEIHKLAGAR